MTVFEMIGKGIEILTWRLQRHGLRITFTWFWTRLYLWTIRRPILRYTRITPQLYVGGQINAAGWRWLESKGITVDVNMRREFDDAEHGFAPEGYLWLPAVDDHAPTMEQLEAGAEFIGQAINKGESVYVHCASGVGRAPTMAAAYLMSTGLSLDQALIKIQEARPFIKITPPQLALLEEYEAKLKQAAESTSD